MTSANVLPFPVGSRASAVDAGLVGRIFMAPDGRKVRLCKTAVTAAPAKKAILYTITGGVASYAKATVANAAAASTFAGIGDPSVGTLAANDYFWVYCGKGDVVQFVGKTAIAAGILVQTNTAGNLSAVGAAATAITQAKLLAGIGIVVDATTSALDTGSIRLLGPA